MKISENEIRPSDVFQEYLKLTSEDVKKFFDNAERKEVSCPACGTKGHKLFDKMGFSYEECYSCKSIFVSPRPIKEAFDAYYADSPSTKYWATTFYKVTEQARREKLWKPKALLIKERIIKYSGEKEVKNLIDIGGGYGIFDEEINQIMEINPFVIEPNVHLADVCRKKGLRVIQKFMEDMINSDLPNGKKCFVSFELFEHLHDPRAFLKVVYDCMEKDDMFIFTTLSGMGIDIQVLQENSRALSPPHHLNFLNPKSVSLLLSEVGFTVLDTCTPGKLDIDILINCREYIRDKAWLNILDYSSEQELESLQEFVASSGLSSHMMITAIKE